MRNTLAGRYGDQPVGMGGVFLIEKGKAKIHVMVRLWYYLFFTEGQTEIAHNQNLVLSKGLVIWKRWKRMGVLEVKIKSSPQSEKRRTLNVLKFPGDHSRIFMKWTKVYC